MAMRPFRLPRGANEPVRSPIGDPRFEGWETVSTFEDQSTAVAWRDHLRGLDIDAACVADHSLDRYGRGDIYLATPGSWSRANELSSASTDRPAAARREHHATPARRRLWRPLPFRCLNPVCWLRAAADDLGWLRLSNHPPTRPREVAGAASSSRVDLGSVTLERIV